MKIFCAEINRRYGTRNTQSQKIAELSHANDENYETYREYIENELPEISANTIPPHNVFLVLIFSLLLFPSCTLCSSPMKLRTAKQGKTLATNSSDAPNTPIAKAQDHLTKNKTNEYPIPPRPPCPPPTLPTSKTLCFNSPQFSIIFFVPANAISFMLNKPRRTIFSPPKAKSCTTTLTNRKKNFVAFSMKIEYDLMILLEITGKADVVEFHKESNGIWRPFPVEYKRGKPKQNKCDEVQLCAQALFLEEMFNIDVPEGALLVFFFVIF